MLLLAAASFTVMAANKQTENRTDYRWKSTFRLQTKELAKSRIVGPIKAVLPQRSTDRSSIKFYYRNDEYYEFTNFYHHPVRIDGHMWPTTEHYFQAQKFVGTPYYDHIRKLPFPRDAFRVSRDPLASRWVRGDWGAVKDDIMLKALRVKFQDEELKRKLLSTNSKTLIEHTSNDSYWADGGNGRGLNKLGLLLMKVRDELRAQDSIQTTVPKRLGSLGEGGMKRSSSCSNLSTTRLSDTHHSLTTNYSAYTRNDIVPRPAPLSPLNTDKHRGSSTYNRSSDSQYQYYTPTLARKSKSGISDGEYATTPSFYYTRPTNQATITVQPKTTNDTLQRHAHRNPITRGTSDRGYNIITNLMT